MANRVVIEVVTRYKDEASKALESAGKTADKVKKKLEDTAGAAAKLGKQKPKLTLDADDRASNKIVKAMDKARSFASRKYKSIVDADDRASVKISKVMGAARSFANKTFSAIVTIKDHATAPLQKIKNSLFSIKTLIAGVMAGTAVKQGILNPIGLADAYSGAKAGFTNILGSEAAGQEMMDKLDAFAKESPFDGAGVISNAQKMISMGWNFTDADSFIDDMRVLGNAAASTGNMNQGLESIVRAMSQIKTKGKLSTEELNQLAEAGIPAKALLAEAMGFGSDDSGIAAMTKQLEKGAIGSQEAIDALMKGMQRFDGMMDSMANETAEGLMAQLKDAFEINIFRRWGQGLQEGAKQGLGSVIDLLDKSEDKLAKVGDVLFELGSNLSTKAAEGLDKVIQKILKITDSEEFANASAGGKAKMLWEEVIAKPLGDWWESSGREKVVSIATEIGTTLGKGIWNAFKQLMKEEPLIGALVGAHAASSLMAPFGGIIGGMSAFGGTAIGKKIIGSTGNYMMQGSGLMNLLANVGYGLTGGSATAGGYFGASTAMAGGKAALLGGGGILGGLVGLLGIGSGIKSLKEGNYWGGGTKLGMVGAGAAAGGALGGPLGALLGAGVGGIGAMLGGDKVGEMLSKLTGKVGEFFNTLPEKWDSLWDGVKDFFSEKVPWALGYATGRVAAFFTVTVPEKWDQLWESLGNFFTETIPTWADDTWNNKIVPFFTESIPGFFDSLWDGVCSLVTEGIPSISDTIWSNIKGFFTDTVPNWFSSVWENLKGGFAAGYGDGGGKKSKKNNAAGGIIGSRTLSWLGEEGPEAVIPLGTKHRNRALDLLQQTGQALGVGGGGGTSVDVGGVHIHISGSGNVAADIENQKEEIAEQIAAIFNRVISAQYENMPARGGA